MRPRILKSLFVASLMFGAACGDSTVGETAPEAPVVDPSVPSVVVKCEVDGCTDTVTIFGIKQASVGITETTLGTVHALDETTEFSFDVTLADGMNVFELRAEDNAGNKSKKARVEILLAVRPDPVEVTGPRIDTVFVWDRPDITWEGNKPAGTGVYMIQEVDGQRVVEALLVAPDEANTWSGRANLQTTAAAGSNLNNFTFLAVTAQNVRSNPVQHQVDYDDVGCGVTITNHTTNDRGELRENQPLEYSEESCVRQIDGEDQHGLCVWTSIRDSNEDEGAFSVYTLEGSACEGSAVVGTIDGSGDLEFRPAINVTTWSKDVKQTCTTCDAADAEGQGTKHVVIWARKEDRDTRKQHVWVTADFTPPTFSDVVFKNADGEVIPDEEENASGATGQACGNTEAGARVTLLNTDSRGGVRGEVEVQADEDGAFCIDFEFVEGDNNLYLSAVDRARNRSEEADNPARLLNVDNTGPDVTFLAPRENAWVSAGPTMVLVEAFDAYNGVDSVRAGIGEGDGVELDPSGNDDGRYSGEVEVPEEGARVTIWVEATDGLGNVNRVTVDVFRSGEPVAVTDLTNAFHSRGARIDIGPNGEVFAVWETCYANPSPCERNLAMASKLGEGGAWGPPIALNIRNSANGADPDVAVDENGVAHIIWLDDGDIGGRNAKDVIYTTWDGTSPTISDETCENIGATPPGQNPETPQVCWAGRWQTQSGMGDATSLTRVGVEGGNAAFARIAVGVLGPRAVFAVEMYELGRARGNEVFVAINTNGAWSPQQLSDNNAGGEDGADKPVIVVDGSGESHVAWQDDGNADGDGDADFDILYARVGVDEPVQIVNGHCGAPGASRSARNATIAVDLDDPNSRVFVGWLAAGGCARGHEEAVMWAFSEQGSPFSSGNDGSGAYMASTGEEFEAANNGSPQIAARSVESDMSTQTVTVVWSTDAPTRGAGNDLDVVMRSFPRDYDGQGNQPAISVVTETRAGEDNDDLADTNPSIGVDPGGAIHVVWEKRALDGGRFKSVYYGVATP